MHLCDQQVPIIMPLDFWIPVRVVGMTHLPDHLFGAVVFKYLWLGLTVPYAFLHTILHTFVGVPLYTMTLYSPLYSSLLVPLRTSLLHMFLHTPSTQRFSRPYPTHTLDIYTLYTKTGLTFFSFLAVMYPISFFSIKFLL